jgi:hypothetical protein
MEDIDDELLARLDRCFLGLQKAAQLCTEEGPRRDALLAEVKSVGDATKLKYVTAVAKNQGACAKYELNITTNDGWVVSLVGDRPMDLGDVALETIIVQPKEDFDKRVAGDPDTIRSAQQLRKEK